MISFLPALINKISNENEDVVSVTCKVISLILKKFEKQNLEIVSLKLIEFQVNRKIKLCHHSV